jgi:hypothetical protein
MIRLMWQSRHASLRVRVAECAVSRFRLWRVRSTADRSVNCLESWENGYVRYKLVASGSRGS